MDNSLLIQDSDSIFKIFLKKDLSSILNEVDYKIYWEGLVFVNGILSGEESVKFFITELRKRGIQDATRLLKGIFFIAVEEKSTGDFYSFVDNSGLFQAFYNQKIISTSFLKIVRHERFTAVNLDPEAVVEYLYFGYLFPYKTFFKTVKKIPSDKICHFSHKDNQLHLLGKNILDFIEPPDNKTKSFHEIFEGLAASLSNRNVSVDLTGGSDTRLIAVMLDYFGLKFETATSGGTSEYKDVSVSKRIAHELGFQWYSTIHSISSLEEDMNELFITTEGMFDILYYHRLYQFQKSRMERGIDTMISGVGGEILKDFMWLQDFPFYSKKSSNIERMLDMRIMSFEPMHFMFAENLSETYKMMRSRMIQELSQYLLETNTKTYDNIYINYIIKGVLSRILTSNSFFLKCYAPFLDLDIVKIGFNLSRGLRFFNMYHRKKISVINPSIAKVPITEGGISLSSEPMMMILDIPKYSYNKLNRLMIKLHLRNKPMLQRDHPRFCDNVRKMELMKDSIGILKEVGIINDSVEMNQIDNRNLGMILSLAMLIKYMSDTN